jgi:hypothetical protein
MARATTLVKALQNIPKLSLMGELVMLWYKATHHDLLKTGRGEVNRPISLNYNGFRKRRFPLFLPQR